jgi:tRNA1Val (adenine37-N6)-methyltransferase
MEEWQCGSRRIDDLERGGLRIIQDPGAFCFGMDAVLLAHFARAKTFWRVLDLGTGSGILPLLMVALFKPQQVVGLEIQPQFARMAQESVELNELQDTIRIVSGDYRDKAMISSLGKFHLCVSNPPYHAVGSGSLRVSESERIARFEVSSTLCDVIQAANACLYNGGHFCMVHLPKRLPEILLEMQRHCLTPKRLVMVHPNNRKSASLILIEGVKNAKPGLSVLPPLFVHAQSGGFSDAMKALYEGGDAL